MFYALISTLFSSIAKIFYKKSLIFEPSKHLHSFIPNIILLIVSCILYFLGFISFSEVRIWIVITLFITILFKFVGVYLDQIIYKNEKISFITPFDGLNKIFVIILSFFIFQDVTVFSLFIALIAVIITVLFTIDFKNFKFPQNTKVIFLRQIITTMVSMSYGFMLYSISSLDFFFVRGILSFLVGLSIFIFLGNPLQDIKMPKAFYKIRFSAAIFGTMGALICFLIIEEFGLVLATLLGFIGTAMQLIFSYFMFGDKPTKKDLILTVIVTILVFLGFYFK